MTTTKTLHKKCPIVDWTRLSPHPVVGVDEVGRGCLAGPVFSCAVILTKKGMYPDSKSISAQQREVLADEIMSRHLYAIGRAEVEEINQINILQASLLAMKRAVLKLGLTSGHIAVDGPFLIPNLPKGFKQTAFVKGDQRVAPIASASIVAKVTRDQWISKQARLYPKYGFASHKGYATAQHRQALLQHGPCPLHRKKFISKLVDSV